MTFVLENELMYIFRVVLACICGGIIGIERQHQLTVFQMCLDGTLWVEDGKPYMIYCHEWVETVDGEMDLGEFGRIHFIDWDQTRGRTRTVQVMIIGE